MRNYNRFCFGYQVIVTGFTNKIAGQEIPLLLSECNARKSR